MAYDFGLRLAQCRKQRRLTQAMVAQKLDMSRATISGYENNTITPSLDVLKSLAILYNVSVDYLLNLHPDPAVEEKEAQNILYKDILTKMQQNINDLQRQVKELY